MLMNRLPIRSSELGVSLLEVLVTIVILAFGLLGLAGLQSKMQLADMESYQRAQAVVLMSEMVDRISANRSNAGAYATAGTIGTGDNQPSSCNGLAMGSDRDICEWSNALKGAAEQKASTNVGAMINARGCITQIQAPNPASGSCLPGIYRVTVTWQGLNDLSVPNLFCPGDVASAKLRSVSSQITVGLPACS
jgi:type IV pilus assembly protein PilV